METPTPLSQRCLELTWESNIDLCPRSDGVPRGRSSCPGRLTRVLERFIIPPLGIYVAGCGVIRSNSGAELVWSQTGPTSRARSSSSQRMSARMYSQPVVA